MIGEVMSHLTQSERVKLGVTVYKILMPNQDAAFKKILSKHCSMAN